MANKQIPTWVTDLIKLRDSPLLEDQRQYARIVGLLRPPPMPPPVITDDMVYKFPQWRLQRWSLRMPKERG